MKTALSGRKTKSKHVPARAIDSICVSELDSNEINERDLQYKKYDGHRMSILHGIVTLSAKPNIKPISNLMKQE
jgi:hypothetical protein